MHLHTGQVLRFACKDYGFHNLGLLFSFFRVDTYAFLDVWNVSAWEKSGRALLYFTLGDVIYSYNASSVLVIAQWWKLMSVNNVANYPNYHSMMDTLCVLVRWLTTPVITQSRIAYAIRKPVTPVITQWRIPYAY